MTSDSLPLVSIGMPVYNGETYLRGALDSILAQTYPNLEVVVADNGSSDRTHEICREYAAADHRVRFVKNERNVGAAGNFNRVFQLSRGKYFKWAAHDDWIAPRFVAECVDRLEADDAAALCWTDSRFIDAAGELNREQPFMGSPDRLSPNASAATRMHEALYAYPGPTIYGLIRSDTLRQTGLFRGTVGSDRVLLVELSLLGGFSWVPDVLFFERHWPVERVGHYTNSYWNPDRKAVGVLRSYVVQGAQCVSVVAGGGHGTVASGVMIGRIMTKYASKSIRRIAWSSRHYISWLRNRRQVRSTAPAES